MRKALIIGINYYEHGSPLYGCVDDAHAVKAVLERHDGGSVNFDCMLHTGTGPSDSVDRSDMKDSIEDTGRHVVHELERYLETLGTVAAITPLLGLLGTVIGMVKVFAAITTHGVGNPTVLAGGIAEALITTAAGLTVAIPALIGYRYYRSRVDTLVIDMEKEAIKLVEALHRRQEKGKE